MMFISDVFILDSRWISTNFTLRDVEIEFFQDVKYLVPQSNAT